jgi:hypothetical protein
VTTAVSGSEIGLSTPTFDTATLAGGTSPSGSLVFKLFGPGDASCTSTPAYTSPLQTVSGDGHYRSPSFTPTLEGTYSWVALYSGDSNNAAVTTACGDPAETLTVGPFVPSGPNPNGYRMVANGRDLRLRAQLRRLAGKQPPECPDHRHRQLARL